MSAKVVPIVREGINDILTPKHLYSAVIVMHSPGFGFNKVEETEWEEQIEAANIEDAYKFAQLLGDEYADELSAEDRTSRHLYKFTVAIKRIEDGAKLLSPPPAPKTPPNSGDGNYSIANAVKQAFNRQINNDIRFSRKWECPISSLCDEVIVLDDPGLSVKLK